jgi:hypothetical protein
MGSMESSDESLLLIGLILDLEAVELIQICDNLYIEQIVMSQPEYSQSLLRGIITSTDLDEVESEKLRSLYQELERVRLEGL